MKRFYCKTCQKIRHVRRMPSTVSNPEAYNPNDRIGVCAWHGDNIRHRTITASHFKAAIKTRKVS